MENKNVNQEWAIFYQKMGLSIIPVEGKIPLIKWAKYQNEKATEEQIKEWWKQWPNASIGCVTGSVTSRLVLDIDGNPGELLADRVTGNTQSVRTRRGIQYHYTFPSGFTDKTTITGILPQVDTRGEGGIVILPPSKCSDGTYYEWIRNWETPLAEAPQWLLDLLTKKEQKVETTKEENKEPWIEEALGGAGEGDRHGTMLKLFGYYANKFPLSVAAAHIRQWNKNNVPPIEESTLEEQIKDLTLRFQKGEYTSHYTEKKERVIECISASTLVKKFSAPPKYLVPGLIPQGTRTIFAGWNGRGKSFVITDLAIEISRKKGHGKWLGQFPVEHGPVLYVDNENARNLASHRLSLLTQPKGLTVDDLNLEFIIGQHLKFTLEQDYKLLKDKIQEIKPVLVIIDSFASTNTVDEDSSKDMRYIMDDLALPLCEEFNTGILFIDHENKGQLGVKIVASKRTRGSGAKLDAADQGFSLDEQEGIVIFQHSKRRYTKRHPDFPIEMVDMNGGVVVRAMSI